MKRIIALLLTVLLLFSAVCTASAAELETAYVYNASGTLVEIGSASDTFVY